MKNELPLSIQSILLEEEWTPIDIGMTDAKVFQSPTRILKIEETHEESNNEYQMLQWLAGRLPVPKVLDFVQHNDTNYLLMEKLEGHMVFDPEIMGDPENMVRLLARAMRMLWEIDISECPYRNTLNEKLPRAKWNLEQGYVDLDDVDDELFTSGRFQSMEDLHDWLVQHRPEEEELVFSHGDFCFPNILMTPDSIIGFLDLGRGGIASKWQDIALCIRSMRYNLEEQYEERYMELLLQELDVTYDAFLIDYYILLDEFS